MRLQAAAALVALFGCSCANGGGAEHDDASGGHKTEAGSLSGDGSITSSDAASTATDDAASVDSASDDSTSLDASDDADGALADDATADASDAATSDGGAPCSTAADCPTGYMCDAPTCTAAGTCLLKPSAAIACKADAYSSCGCNGRAYTSICAAHKAGIRIAHTGACTAVSCTSTADCSALGAAYDCAFGLGNCSYAGYCLSEPRCPAVVTAACGCDGTTKSTNQCLADKAGTRLLHTGACP